MTDPFLSRDWGDGHARFSSDLARGLRRLGRMTWISLQWLQHYNFDAPWRREAQRRGKRPRARIA